MRLNAAIALQGLSDDVDDVVEQIRYLLHQVDPNVDVEVKSVGIEFGFRVPPDPFPSLLLEAEQRRRDLLWCYWGDRKYDTLLAAQRVGQAIGTMNAARIRLVLEETVIAE